ncbi:MAG: MBL fold metallo-hydrolase [Candidatus Tectomicrobia bacterium]|uniref:MBL fold metallo-hydrolase n=1 Tax=Tectimicrobiota bacterium TaxID=2528274 RepID=A0A932MPY7_UNCTE|nr:MBL fold metallo-hydrolase [Candidatus Tectomicrobia bacterium]
MRAGLFALAAAGIGSGCARLNLGLTPPEPDAPRAVGLLSREPEALYWPHGGPGAWFNPWWPSRHSRVNLLKWKLLYRNEFAEARRTPPPVPVVENPGDYLARPESSASITSVGHCTFVIKDGPDTLLTDPHFGPRSLLYGRHHAPGVPLGKIPGGALAVLSHNHYDHLDTFTLERLPRSVAWYVPMGLGEYVRSHGPRRVTELDWWQSARHGRWTLTCLPAQHWSNRIGQGRDATLWCAWMLDSGERRYFFSGDSGYFQGFAEFARRFGSIDAAMLSIGAYEPRWMMRYPHMNPAEGYEAFLDLRARWMIPMHWGVFDLTDEPIGDPPQALARAVQERGGSMDNIKIMAIGERWQVG